MKAAGHIGNVEVALARQRASLCGDSSLQVGYRERWDHCGVTDFQVALVLIGLAFPCKRTTFGAIPQLMLLDKVNAQYKRLVQLGYDIKFVLYELFVYSKAELIQALHWQRMISC